MLNYIEMNQYHSVGLYRRHITEICVSLCTCNHCNVIGSTPVLNDHLNTVLSPHSSRNSQVLSETSMTIPHFEHRVRFTTL